MKKFEKIIQTEDFVAFDFCSLVFAVIFVCFGSGSVQCKILNILYFEKFLCLLYSRDFVFHPRKWTKWDFNFSLQNWESLLLEHTWEPFANVLLFDRVSLQEKSTKIGRTHTSAIL